MTPPPPPKKKRVWKWPHCQQTEEEWVQGAKVHRKQILSLSQHKCAAVLWMDRRQDELFVLLIYRVYLFIEDIEATVLKGYLGLIWSVWLICDLFYELLFFYVLSILVITSWHCVACYSLLLMIFHSGEKGGRWRDVTAYCYSLHPSFMSSCQWSTPSTMQ